jgi:hypothetical protein
MITQARLKELLNYDPDTGVWTWRVWRGGSAPRVGEIACHKQQRPRQIKIMGRLYQTSHLAFLYMMGQWPRRTIDHINLDYLDDRWCNLREATKQEQSCNKRGWARSGYKGVTVDRNGGFIARIGHNSEVIYLGWRRTAEEAYELYRAAAAKLHGAFACADHRGK